MKPYIYYLVFSLIFYMQNFIYSLFSSFVFVPNLLEFIFIYIIVLLISKTPYPKTIFTLWQSLYLIHFSFISFFGRSIISSDIYLFFTHFSETIETLAYTLHMYKVSFIISIFIFVLIFFVKFKKVGANSYMLISLFILGVFFLPNKLQDSSFLLLQSLKEVDSTCSNIDTVKSSKRLTPLNKSDINIVLVIGESMRAKEYQKQKYEMFENFVYKTIYAGATSTDVSVPLLLNGAIKPSSIDMSNNLFSLAKQNNLRTTFISVQSEKSMKYIKPYLSIEDIDNYNIIGSRDDLDLVNKFKNIEQNQTNLIVLQMQGEHSPYIYYPHVDKNDDIQTRYTHGMNYSNKIILEMIEYIKTLEKETIFIFTSDHGELLGEGGRYGHNTFKEQVYRVPFIYLNNSTCKDISPLHVESHNDIYRLIFHLLGYENKRKNKDKSIRVNGTMINEEDGYKIFDILPK